MKFPQRTRINYFFNNEFTVIIPKMGVLNREMHNALKTNVPWRGNKFELKKFNLTDRDFTYLFFSIQYEW